MSLSIFQAIFDLIAAAGSYLRVTTTLSSSPCKVDTHRATRFRGRVPREAEDRADMGGNGLVLSAEAARLFFFLRNCPLIYAIISNY